MKKLESHEWWPELVSLKDELSLRELGERFGITPGAIMNAFRRNGIERKHAPPGPRRHRKGADKAPSLPPEPGEGEGRSGSKDALIAAHLDLLGSVPDRVVADKAGVALRTVAAYRARHNIPGYAGPRIKRSGSKTRRSRIDPFAGEVGSVPDRVIAAKAGVTVNAVRNWRRARGVVAHGRDSGASLPRVAPAKVARAATAHEAPPPAVAPGAFAWRVTLDDGTVGVVVGASLSDAARNADAAGVVLSMERIGALLN